MEPTPSPDLPDGKEIMRKHAETDYFFLGGARPAMRMRVGDRDSEIGGPPPSPLINLMFRPLFAVAAFWDTFLRGPK